MTNKVRQKEAHKPFSGKIDDWHVLGLWSCRAATCLEFVWGLSPNPDRDFSRNYNFLRSSTIFFCSNPSFFVVVFVYFPSVECVCRVCRTQNDDMGLHRLLLCHHKYCIPENNELFMGYLRSRLTMRLFWCPVVWWPQSFNILCISVFEVSPRGHWLW